MNLKKIIAKGLITIASASIFIPGCCLEKKVEEIKKIEEKPKVKVISEVLDGKWIRGELINKIYDPSGYFVKILVNNDIKKIYELKLTGPRLGIEPWRTPDFIYNRFKIGDKVKFIGFKKMRDCDPSILKEGLDPNSPYKPPYDYYDYVNIERFPEGKGEIPGDEIYTNK